MLKVERCKRDDQVNIRLINQGKRFDRYFLIAFGFALFIHLSAAFIFQVHLFSFGAIETILSSTTLTAPLIKSSIDESDAVVTSRINMEGRLTPAHLAPILSIPTIVHEDYAKILRPSLLTQSDLLEKEDLPVAIAPVQIHVSGPLAEYHWQLPEEFSPLFIKEKIMPGLQRSFLYDVLVDGTTGQIFWYKGESNPLAEKLLKLLHFEKDQTINNGQIEIVISTELK